MKILAIESSCDETSAAVVSGGDVLSNIISSQHFHTKWGGVVPELASRAHIKNISEVVKEALASADMEIGEMDSIAVTTEPGLMGSLIVGSNFAKGLALRHGLPLIPINHIDGHLYSGCLQEPEMEFPFITLVVSGGHTVIFYVESYSSHRILGATRDDAAGEAFDKIAALMGLGYPGGPEVDKLAKNGNPDRFEFPRSMIYDRSFDFSFSGLKTSVRYFVHKEYPNGIPESDLPDLCASVQSAIVDVLVSKTIRAARYHKVKWVVVAGGVSANSELRKKMAEAAGRNRMKFVAPDMNYCMDNAAMIGFIAGKKLSQSGPEAFQDLTFVVSSSAIRAESKKRKKH